MSVIPSVVEGSCSVLGAHAEIPARRGLLVGREVRACAPQTTRDPSTSVGMTEGLRPTKLRLSWQEFGIEIFGKFLHIAIRDSKNLMVVVSGTGFRFAVTP